MRRILSFLTVILSILGFSTPSLAYDILNRIHLPNSEAELETLLHKSGISLEDLQSIENKRLSEMTSEELKKIIILKDLSKHSDTDSCMHCMTR